MKLLLLLSLLAISSCASKDSWDQVSFVTGLAHGKKIGCQKALIAVDDSQRSRINWEYFEKEDPCEKMYWSTMQSYKSEAALKYLADTDFYVIRMMDTGVPLPDGMHVLRQAARASIVR